MDLLRNRLFQLDEDEIQEVEYAGVTATWLRKAIAKRARQALLHAQKKHLAALRIQSNFRGWKVRKRIALLKATALKIQKTWRGFLGRIRYFSILEVTLREHITAYYGRCATRIQALFRGFYSRKYNHDHWKLKELKLRAACELLECIALKTRELVKNKQVPGVYSLRNSKCLSKVEQLMASLRIRQYNEDVRESRHIEVNMLTKAFEKSYRSTERTEIPFGRNCARELTRSRTQISNSGSGPLFYQLVTLKEPPIEEISADSEISDLSYKLYKSRRKSNEVVE